MREWLYSGSFVLGDIIAVFLLGFCVAVWLTLAKQQKDRR